MADAATDLKEVGDALLANEFTHARVVLRVFGCRRRNGVIERDRQPFGILDAILRQLLKDRGDSGAVVVAQHNIRFDDDDVTGPDLVALAGARQQLFRQGLQATNAKSLSQYCEFDSLLQLPLGNGIDHAGGPMLPQDLRDKLNHNIAVNIFDGSLFGFGVSGLASYVTIIPLFLSYLTESTALIGFVATLFHIGWQVPQLLTSSYVASLRRYKPMVLAMTLVERVPYFGLALLAFTDSANWCGRGAC